VAEAPDRPARLIVFHPRRESAFYYGHIFHTNLLDTGFILKAESTQERGDFTRPWISPVV